MTRHLLQPPDKFHYAVSAQLFLSICFAQALSGSLLLVDFSAREADKAHVLFCLPLSLWVLLIVWRQYGLYYLPVQHYRQCADTIQADSVTLFITVLLGVLPVLCGHNQALVPFCLMAVIILTFMKVNELESLFDQNDPDSQEAREAFFFLRKQLLVYLAVVLAISITYWLLGSYLTDYGRSVVIGMVFLLGYFGTRWILTDFFGRADLPRLVKDPDAYNEAVRRVFFKQVVE